MEYSLLERLQGNGNNTNNTHTPDVLSCLSNLSNDEVFTPPDIVNAMLDMLPQELFSNPNTKFLDPACKTGVFLREITKRLLVGLENEIPDLQTRIDHILHNQVYGIAITELTSLLSRRSLYCSKYPNGHYSVSHFDNAEGNIRFKKIQHKWNGERCIYCGANRKEYDRKPELETHAYEFIHLTNLEELKKMNFDVIISNPPYQLSDGGAQASAMPIYNKFIEQSKKLNPRYITMITPSRWFTGGKGLDTFRKNMLEDNRIKEIHDFTNAEDCFPGVQIKGGVNYFLWDKNYHGNCTFYTHSKNEILDVATRPLMEKGCDVLIRNNKLVSILKKVQAKGEASFSEIVSPQKPYGFRGDFFKDPYKYGLPSIMDKPMAGAIKIYGLDEKQKRTVKYLAKNYPIPKRDYLPLYKMFMSRNQGSGFFGEKLSEPIFAKPNEACTETFIVIGLFDTEDEMQNCWSYIKTKFFRSMLAVKKNDQGAASGVYEFIPLQDFSKPWSDEELYKKYNLSNEEIEFIETNVEGME